MKKILVIAIIYFLSGNQGIAKIAYEIVNNELLIANSVIKNTFLTINTKDDFLTASIIKTKKVKYYMASFHFKEKIIKHYASPSILKIEQIKDENLILNGFLKSSDNDSIPYRIIFKMDNSSKLSFEIATNDQTIDELKFRFKSSAEEHFFGGGEQYSHFDLKGKYVPMFSEEQGLGRGDQPITRIANIAGAGGNEFTTYTAIPFVLSTNNRGFFIKNTERSAFDLTQDNSITLMSRSNQLKGFIWTGKSPLHIIEQYTFETGRMPQLPDWAYGTWLGLQGGKEKALDLIRKCENHNNPVTAIWIQDWVGKRKTRFGSQLWWNWNPDEKSYPGFKNFCKELNQKNIKVLGYINSFLANEGPMFELAKEKGYFVKNAKGEDYEIATAGFPAYLIDLTNPEAYNWLKEVIKTNLIGNGLSGWMADYAEWLPFDAVLHSGEDAASYHNQYPVDWVKLNREAIQETNNEGKIVFFNRAGYGYSNKYSTLFWEGDQMNSWQKNDGLPSAILALNSSGISGISLNHSDIGGYTTVKLPFIKYIRSQELNFRWMEANAFTPIYRTHEGLKPELNNQFYSDSISLAFFAKMGRLHYSLKEYFAFLNKEATEKGIPVIRHPYLCYPNDANTYDLKYQFMVGNDLLVLPVIEEGANTVNGYFPKGEWENIWTGEIINSKGYHPVVAPLGQPAAYLKVGGEWYERLKKSLKNK